MRGRVSYTRPAGSQAVFRLFLLIIFLPPESIPQHKSRCLLRATMPGKFLPWSTSKARNTSEKMRKSQQKTSVLIVRLGDTGDIVLASPVAEAIRKRSPNAHICWLCQKEFKGALEGHPAVDEIICWDRKSWAEKFDNHNYPALLNEVRLCRRELRQYRFDLALDLQGLVSSAFLTWLSGAKTRIGLGSGERGNLLMTRTISRNMGDQAQVGAEYRYLMYQLGYPEHDWKMHVPLPAHAIESANELLAEALGQQPYVVICPFSSQQQKLWPDESWQQLILRIRGRYQLKTVILGNESDNEKAQNIAKLCGATNLSGKTDFQENAAIIKGAALLIGVDTGLTHLGHALKIPTISLFGSSCPYSHTGQESSTVIYLDKVCSPCGSKPSCKGRFDCMKEISPDLVLTEIKPLMKNYYEPSRIKAG